MLRNYPEIVSGPRGTAEINGASDRWFLTLTGSTATLEFSTRAAAKQVAEDWCLRGVYPVSAQTVELPAVPEGAFQ